MQNLPMDKIQLVFRHGRIFHCIYSFLPCTSVQVTHFSTSFINFPSEKGNGKKSNKETIKCTSAYQTNKTLVSLKCPSTRILNEEIKLFLKEYKFLKFKKEKVDSLYILHSDLADFMVEKLSQEPFRKQNFIFEINPGPGILTKKLLEAGFKKVKAFESKVEFLPDLVKLQQHYSKELLVKNIDFLSLPKMLAYLHSGNDREVDIFEEITSMPWNGNPPFTIVGVLPPAKELIFMRYLIMQLIDMMTIYSYGRAELIVFLSGKEIEYMFSTPESRPLYIYRYGTIMYQLFFDIDIIYKEPRESFYPLQKASNKKLMFPYDREHLYLVKIIPKKNLLSLGLTINHLREFFYFVRFLLHRRTWPLLEHLNKWMPHQDIYKLGYTKNKTTGDLSPEEFLYIFKHMVKQPDYKSSIFPIIVSHNSLFNREDSELSDSLSDVSFF